MSSPKSRKSVTLADLARAAGISKTTASHALSGKGWVKPATREAVIRLAQEMEFEVDPLARILSNGRSDRVVGLYTLDLDLSGRTRQIQMIQSKLCDLGYTVPIYAYGYRGNDLLDAQMGLLNSMLAQRPGAVVCNTSGVRPEVFERLDRFVEEGGVLVCYGYNSRAPINCDQVVQDEGAGYSQAAQYLVDLGHRNIGMFNVGHRKPEGTSLAALTSALSRVGAAPRDEWLFANDGTQRYEVDGMRVGHEFLALQERPTAMIVANDYAAVGFLAAVSRGGVKVPGDLSVVGFDDDAIAPCGVVPLTTVTLPVDETADSVIDLLHGRLMSTLTGPSQIRTFAGSLVHRESCGAPSTV